MTSQRYWRCTSTMVRISTRPIIRLAGALMVLRGVKGDSGPLTILQPTAMPSLAHARSFSHSVATPKGMSCACDVWGEELPAGVSVLMGYPAYVTNTKTFDFVCKEGDWSSVDINFQTFPIGADILVHSTVSRFSLCERETLGVS